MKWFRELVRCAENNDYASAILDAASEAEVFVFTDETNSYSRDEVINCGKRNQEEGKDLVAESTKDYPFSCFAYEMAEGRGFLASSHEGYKIFCVLVKEHSWGNNEYFLLVEYEGRKTVICAHQQYHDVSDEVARSGMQEICCQSIWLTAIYMEKLYTQFVGQQRVNWRTKVKIKSSKTFIKVRKITYVSPSLESKDKPHMDRGEIEWSNHWLVRGHWRVCKGMGVDRNGDRVIKGYTWITPYKKGDKDKPLLRKTRIVNQYLGGRV